VLVHALTGFVDAGQAGHVAVAHVLAHLEHRVVATFDIDQLLDYRSRRPMMTFERSEDFLRNDAAPDAHSSLPAHRSESQWDAPDPAAPAWLGNLPDGINSFRLGESAWHSLYFVRTRMLRMRHPARGFELALCLLARGG
jgi:hypothetical protein